MDRDIEIEDKVTDKKIKIEREGKRGNWKHQNIIEGQYD